MKKIINSKRAIFLLIAIILVLSGIIIYGFIINPQIQSTKIDFYNQGVIDTLNWIDNQIQANSQAQINLDRQIICEYGT